MSRRGLILLFERLEMYAASGLPISGALRASAECAKPAHRSMLDDVVRSVESGESVAKALSVHMKISTTVASLIRHGESSGGLVGGLALARSVMEREDEIRKKCLSAMTYPIVIGVFATLLTLGLVRGIMPQIVPMLESLHVQLPFVTVVVITISKYLMSYGSYACISLCGLCVAFKIAYTKLIRFRSCIHSVAVHTPIIGKFIYSYTMAAFFNSCGALVESGLPSPVAYARAAETVTFMPFRNFLIPRSIKLQQGASLASLLSGRFIPSYIPSLIAAGDASGSLGRSMKRVAMILDRDLEHSLKRLTSLIEPVMMVGMGCMVGSIALSIMMPIYDISKVLQHA